MMTPATLVSNLNSRLSASRSIYSTEDVNVTQKVGLQLFRLWRANQITLGGYQVRDRHVQNAITILICGVKISDRNVRGLQ